MLFQVVSGCFMLFHVVSVRSPSEGNSCLLEQVQNHPPARHVGTAALAPPSTRVTVGNSGLRPLRPSKAWNCHLSNHSSPNRSHPWRISIIFTLETFHDISPLSFKSFTGFSEAPGNSNKRLDGWCGTLATKISESFCRASGTTPIRQWKKGQNRKTATYNHYQSLLIWVVLFHILSLLNTINTVPSGQRWTARSRVSKARNLPARAWWLPPGVWWRPSGSGEKSQHACTDLHSALVRNWLYQKCS